MSTSKRSKTFVQSPKKKKVKWQKVKWIISTQGGCCWIAAYLASIAKGQIPHPSLSCPILFYICMCLF